MDKLGLFEKFVLRGRSSGAVIVAACLSKKIMTIDVVPPLGPDINERIKKRMVQAIYDSVVTYERRPVTESVNDEDPFAQEIIRDINDSPELAACRWLIMEIGASDIRNMITSSNFPVTPDLKLSLCADIMEMVIIEQAEQGDVQFFKYEAHLRDTLNTFLCIDKSSVFVPPPTQTFNIYSDV